MVHRIVVIGGDAAGASAAATAKRRWPESDVVLLERGHDTSYAACGLPYWVGGQIADRDDLIARTPQQHRANGIDVHLGAEAVGIDPDAGTVTVISTASPGDDVTETIEVYDTLVIATGGAPVSLPLPGVEAPNVRAVHTLDGTEHLISELLAASESATANVRGVIIGAGFVGIEMAEAFRSRGMSVTVLDAADAPMPSLDQDMSALLADRMVAQGITCSFGQRVQGIETSADGRATAVVTEDSRFPADIVVMAVGIRPNTAFAARSGIPVGESGGILTDRSQRVLGQPSIYAAGDCVETYHRLLRRNVHLPLGTHANKQGRVAGVNLSGGNLTFPGVIGTAITRVGTAHVSRTGLSEAEARDTGFDTVSATVDTSVIAGYMPDPGTMTTKLIAERGTGRILGGQIIGDRAAAAKRIDTVAVAIWQSMTAEELTSMDLSYAPPFSGVWDPVQVASRRLVGALADGF